MTDNKTPLTTEPVKKTDSKTKAPVSKTTKTSSTKAPAKKTADDSKNKISKLAVVAIIIAFGSTAGHYYWQQQQTIKLSEQVENKNKATFNQFQGQIKQALIEQQNAFAEQLQQVTNQVTDNNQAKITELSATVDLLEQKLKQRQPSDWLIHEAEYLIRVAARTVWLEHDTTAAIGLLKNADSRLADLNDPAFLPARELVHQDIKSLELMPTLQTDEVVLTLMAMNKQVAMLPLAMVDVGAEAQTNQELSSDINDWQANLTKTWKKFIDDFIRVRQRTGMVEPLVTPEQQQHLKQNLKLKIQLASWAASERKDDIYQKALADIQQWFAEFFDLEEEKNQRFLQAVAELQTKRISFDYPSELSSLTAIRTALKAYEATAPITAPTEPQTSPTEVVDDVEEPVTEKQVEAIEPEQSSSVSEERESQPKSTNNEEEII